MKTDDEWKEFLLFKLLDYDLTDINYLAIDFDGEIVVSSALMRSTTTAPTILSGGVYWISPNINPNNNPNRRTTNIFIDEDCIPDNYATMLIKL